MSESRVLSIIEQIYDAALDSRGWSAPLCSMADFCGEENASLVVIDEKLGFSSVISPRADPGVIADYDRYWWQHDPTAQAVFSTPVGRITSFADTGREAFLASAFYNDYWSRSGFGAERVAANLVIGDGALVSCGLQAPTRRDEISNEAHERFALFVPHLVRAAETARKLDRLEQVNALNGLYLDHRATNVVIVDAAARIVYMGAEADTLIATDPAFRSSNGALRLTDGKADTKLREAIVSCCGASLEVTAGGHIETMSGAGAHALCIEVMRYRATSSSELSGPQPAAMLVLSHPNLDRERRMSSFRECFGLTQAEAALTVEMLKGDGRAAAAARCGISINTARTHLMRIFEKTGVGRQAELIRLMLDCEHEGSAGFRAHCRTA